MTDEQFGWWLAGLVDGEGHFGITVAAHRVHPYYRCVFRVCLAATDRAVLEMAQRRTGWGILYQYEQKQVARGRRQPYVVWNVQTKQVGQVADFFDRYPLQSRKAEDFRIWAPAARAQVQRRRNGRARDEGLAGVMENAYMEMLGLRRSKGPIAA